MNNTNEKNRQVVDRNDNLLGCKLQRYVDYSQDIYRVSSLWLINSKNQVLLAKRASHKSNGGLWGPAVAGTVESTETYLSSIIKESREEIGLVDAEFEVGPKIFIDHERKFFAQYFIAHSDKSTEEFKLEDAIDAVKWVDADWLEKDVRENRESYVPGMTIVLEALSGWRSGRG